MQLKNIVLTATVLLASAAVSVFAGSNKTPVTKWTCADFLAVEDQYKPKVVYAATAYSNMGKPEAAVIDIEGTERVTPMVVSECTKAPHMSFMDKLKGEWTKFKTELKK